MKHHYLTFAAALACSMLFSTTELQAQERVNHEIKLSAKVSKKHKQNAPLLKATKGEPQAQKIETHAYDPSTKTWSLSSISNLTYDQNNRLLTQENHVYDEKGNVYFSTKEACTYNEQGNITELIGQSSEDGTNWTNDFRRIAAYDNIRTDVPVLRENYMWNPDDKTWFLEEENEENFMLEIERDQKNRITKSTHWLNSNKPIALAAHEFTYAEEGPAIGMTWSALDENYELVPSYVFEDMKWKESDSQYLLIAPNLFYSFDMDKNNVLQSYTLNFSTPEGTKGDLMCNYTATFDKKDRLRQVKLVFADGISNYICDYLYDIDANGSFTMNELIEMDDDQDGTISELEHQFFKAETTLNSHGDIILEEMFVFDNEAGELVQTEGYGYELTYDDKDLVRELVLTYYSEFVTENNGYDYLSKMLYSDYTEATSIQQATATKADVTFNGHTLHFQNAKGAHYTICDFQGKTYQHGIVTSEEMSVDNLPAGMYIVKVSGKNANNALKLIKK